MTCITPCDVTIPPGPFRISGGRAERTLPSASDGLDIEVDVGWNDQAFTSYIISNVYAYVGIFGTLGFLLGRSVLDSTDPAQDGLFVGMLVSGGFALTALPMLIHSLSDPPGGDVRVFRGDRRVASLAVRPVASVERGRVTVGLVTFGRF